MTLLSERSHFTATDQGHMAHALDLAQRARGRTHPNPMVGCVLAHAETVVGEGYHPRHGMPHAEVYALHAAGAAARGATAYVTLEPCHHFGKTPPCTQALIQAGVSRVVAAMLDPDPRVSGRGAAALQAAGIAVDVGLMELESRRLNRPYLTHRITGRPMVTLKAAATLDGKIASSGGETQWITGESARRHVHQVRDEIDAIVVGIGTIRADDPQLTTRLTGVAPDWGSKDPLRVILDSMARTPLGARVLSKEVLERPGEPGAIAAPTIIAATTLAPPQHVEKLQQAGAEVLLLEPSDGLVPLPALLDELGRRGVCHVLVEGGPQVNWSFLEHQLVDRVMLYLSLRLIGGVQTPGFIAGPGAARLADAWPVRDLQVAQVGEDLLLTGDLKPAPWEETRREET